MNKPYQLPREFAEKEQKEEPKFITGETFDEAVARYKNHPKEETFEERKARINRFRCGY